MVPGWIWKVSRTIATIGATVLKVSTIPKTSRMMFCGFEKKVTILLRSMAFVSRVPDAVVSIDNSSVLKTDRGVMSSPAEKSVHIMRFYFASAYLVRVSIQLPTPNAASAQYSGSSSTSSPVVVHQS